MNKLNEEQKKETIEKKNQAVHDADGRVGLPMHKFLGLIGFQLPASRSSLFVPHSSPPLNIFLIQFLGLIGSHLLASRSSLFTASEPIQIRRSPPTHPIIAGPARIVQCSLPSPPSPPQQIPSALQI
jgi:hypothetical protein